MPRGAAPAAAIAPAPLGGGTSRRSALLGTLLVWVLMIHMSIPLDIFSADKAGFGAVNVSTKIIKLSLLIIGAACAFSQMSMFKALLGKLNRFYVYFLFLVPLSYVWSISPGDTFSRFLGVLTITFVAFGLCIRGWDEQQFQRSARGVILLILVGSLIFGLVDRDLAIEHGEGTLKDAWHGLTVTKNTFGQLSSFGAIFWAHAWLSREVSVTRSLPSLGIALFCLLLSRSSTALLATMLALMFLVMLMRTPPGLRRYMPYIVGVFACVVVTYAVAVLRIVPGLDYLLEPVAAITGKDTTFSARSVIWDIVKQHIQLNPFLGTGYGAFWIGPQPTSPSYVFIWKMYFYPGESHNGYLEMVNDLGYVGLTVLLGYMNTYLKQALRLIRIHRSQGALFLALFFEQALNNLSEATWLDVNAAFIFSIMTLATVSMARALLQHDLQLQRAAASAPAFPDPQQRARVRR